MAAPRPRFSRYGTYNPAKYTEHKADFLELAKAQGVTFHEGAIRMEVIFFMPIPASLSKKKQEALNGSYHVKKPDTDNLIKTVKDSLEGTFYKNDSQICEIKAMKMYDYNPRVQLNFYDIS